MTSRPVLLRLADAFVRIVRRHRRVLAAVAAFAAVLTALDAVAPARSPTVPLVVAARDLPGGTMLAASDLQRIEAPPGLAPVGAQSDAAALVGRVTNGPVSERSPITSATIATGTELARPGYVVMSVPLADAALADLLRPGSVVDLIAPALGKVAASRARVVSAPAASAGGLLASGQRVLLVEVTPEAATALAAALDVGGVTVVVR